MTVLSVFFQFSFLISSSFIVLLILLFEYGNSVLLCKCNDHNYCTGTCRIEDKGHCYSAKVVTIDQSVKYQPARAKVIKKYGCLSTTTKSFLSCKGHYVNLSLPIAIDCCNKTNLCNSNLTPVFHHHDSDSDAIRHAIAVHLNGDTTASGAHNDPNRSGFQSNIVLALIFVPILVVCLLIFFVMLFYCHKRLKWDIRESKLILQQTPKGLINLHSRSNAIVDHVKLGAAGDCSGTETTLLVQHKGTTESVMTASSLVTNSTSAPLTGQSQQKLTQRTVGHQILFRDVLGKGRFSKVWVCEWLGEVVTVKCLMAGINQSIRLLDEMLWLRTIHLYYSWPLRHNAIVGLLGSDKMPIINQTESVIVEQYQTEFMMMGSGGVRPFLIYPYFHWGTLARLMATSHWDLTLNKDATRTDVVVVDGCNNDGNAFTDSRLETLTRMAFSLAAGLCYLHTEIAATKGKPAMAHRNLKSSNVYVKDDYSCCIGDLEWVVVSDSKPCERVCALDSHILNQPATPNGLVHVSDFEFYVSNVLLPSECRYVAPELLESMDPSFSSIQLSRTVEDYKKSDVYSLSLILWELLVWFEPRLKYLSYQTQPNESAPSEPITWIYEPAYQSEIIKLRQSHVFDIAQLNEEPRSSEMRLIVLDQAVRPLINYQDTSDQCSPSAPISNTECKLSSINIVDLLCLIIPQCWCTSPDSRLTSLKIKKYISELQDALTTNSEEI